MRKSAEAFRTISEVAEELDVQKHVLRFWEVKFPQIKPLKRGGGRRFYRPADVQLLSGIRALLHSDGYTIKGVQRILRDSGVRFVKECWGGNLPDENKPGGNSTARQIPNLAGEAASEARRETIARNAQASNVPAKPDEVKVRWTDEQRVALGAVLDELEDCRNILRDLLSQPNRNC